MNGPKKVTITIPTYNSEATIEQALDSIVEQDYPHIETIIVDSHSEDRTRELCRNYPVQFVEYDGKLLGARFRGAAEASGEYVLLMDSDQILRPDCVSKCVGRMSDFDMLVIEEFTHDPTGVVGRLFEADRRLVHEVRNLDPVTGVLLPRFFDRELLLRAFKQVPEELYPVTVAHDHALIYFEAYKLSMSVGFVPNGVEHIEPNSIRKLLRKNYRYGRTTDDMKLTEYDRYQQLVERKTSFRSGLFSEGVYFESVLSLILLLIKGVPYKLGQIKNR